MHVSQQGVMKKSVYDPDRDGRIEKDALEITLDKILKGAGPASDPTEADAPEPALHLSGLDADKPAATEVVENTFYYSIDTFYTYKSVGGSWAVQSFGPPWGALDATLADFQANGATGTLTTVAGLNDNSVGSEAYGNGIGEYGEVDFGFWVKIDQWRQYGHADNNNDGFWKIQYFDGAWHDWVVGIPTRPGTWSTMSPEIEVTCQKIRWTITTVDSFGRSSVRELEVYHS